MSVVVDEDSSTSNEAQKLLTSGQTEDSRLAAEDEKQETSRNEEKVETQPNKLKMAVQSQVSATENNVFSKTTTHPQTQILSPVWVFGMNPAVPVFSLQDHDQLVVLYAAGNTGIIYNHTSNSQHILQGHSHQISCMCVSEDRRWVATGDTGSTSMVIIWDSYSGIPVRTMFDCHPAGGVCAIAFSSDAKLLVTVGCEDVQCVCIWDWTSEDLNPLCCTELDPKHGFQAYVTFKPNDSSQLLSRSKTCVLFYKRDNGTLQYYAVNLKQVNRAYASVSPKTPLDSPKGVCVADVSLSLSAFHCTKPQVLTATDGSIVVWDVSEVENPKSPREYTKTLKLQQDPITVLTVTDGFIVISNIQGQITFYDENFLLLNIISYSSQDAIVFISFSKEYTEGYLSEYTLKAERVILRNLIVSTESSKILHVNAQTDTFQIVLREPSHAVACHPSQPVVAMGSQGGILKMWDYNKKLTIARKNLKIKMQIQCVTFDPKGFYLAVGFRSGAVHILNSQTLQQDPEECFHCATDSIHLITFSSDSEYLATADAGMVVTVYCLKRSNGSPPQWTYLGRNGSHYKPIKDLLFGVHLDSAQPRLLSLGLDRRLVEYDLKNSMVNKLLILSSERIEQSAVPLCMTWYPPLTTEQFLLIASDQYKLKLFNSTSKMCRKTLRGPIYGSPIKQMVVLPKSRDPEINSYILAYITEDKVGLQILPLDGNPHKSNALICHPTGVSTLTCSYDGRFVFTAGRSDCCAQSWEINLNVLEAEAALGGQGMTPFYTLLDGGRDGKFYKAIKDNFIYCQLRHQESKTKKNISTKIPLSEISYLMRAVVGHCPSEQETENMLNEVKFSKYAETGKYVTEINLEEFTKLHINHRPAFDISSKAVHDLGRSDGTGRPILLKQDLMELLQTRGECMTEEEVEACVAKLLGPIENENGAFGKSSEYLLSVIPDEISVETFRDLLGHPNPAEQTSARSSLPE
ncbi:cilia- and flagella-associated protein 251 [Nematolebias whitei]|uniref:cilia- and flagella-associated protein 251 n=1 Tax=Nematolebias whitei TaxID=451745 RepID=UPI00189814C2|nr:cilia- and flagella-associated protein 251 [Nematolebias whitei]